VAAKPPDEGASALACGPGSSSIPPTAGFGAAIIAWLRGLAGPPTASPNRRA